MTTRSRSLPLLSFCALTLALAACDTSSDPSNTGGGGAGGADGGGGAGGSTSSGTTTTSNAELAIAALDAAFVDQDPDALDEYFDPQLVRHNPFAQSDGTAELKELISGGALSGVKYTRHRVLAEDDLVVIHGTYDGFPAPGVRSVTFDLFRFDGGKIVEHWDCMQPDPGMYVSGHTMVDGPTEVDPAADTAASKDVVITPGKGFLPVVILGGDFSKLQDYLGTYIQHDPLVGDGLEGLGAALSQPPLDTMKLVSVHRSVADHDFVFVRSKGTMTWEEQKPGSPDNPTVFCDLFRVENGKIEEHWDVIQLDPNSTDVNNLETNGAGHTMWE